MQNSNVRNKMVFVFFFDFFCLLHGFWAFQGVVEGGDSVVRHFGKSPACRPGALFFLGTCCRCPGAGGAAGSKRCV